MKPKYLEIKEHELYLHNYALSKLAKEYGTPLYVYDEVDLKDKMNEFKTYFRSDKFNTRIVYASKAFLVPKMANLVNEAGLSMDAVSLGDLYVALSCGFPLDKIVFHGNNKSDEELTYAIDHKVGLIVVDNLDELKRLIKLATKKETIVNTLFRVNPGINVHTHKYTKTALYVSKFGESIYDDDMIDAIIKTYLNNSFVKLLGFHSHIGSQIKESNPFVLNIQKMVRFSKQIEEKYKINLPVLNLGGGFGIKYYERDKEVDLKKILTKMVKTIEKECAEVSYLPKTIMIEPGRSIVGTPGITLYECGMVKHTFGGKNYLFINGGMTDNIRPALYQAKYEVEIANKIAFPKDLIVDVAGKCCESGDIIAHDVAIAHPDNGDTLVVYATGAYTYSMASNYNNILKPAVIFVGDKVEIVSHREELSDLNKLF